MAVFIQSFLSHRSFRVQVSSSISSSFTQYEGVPQGSVLSTTLFLIAVNGIVSTLPLGVRSSLYVDDLTIYSSGPSLPALQTLIQAAISTTSSWATTHGFRFSPTKSFSIFFTRSFAPLPPPLTLYGIPLQYRSSGKFLGLLFDSRLTWKEHILSLKNTTSRRLRLLQTLSHVSWGADRKTLLYLHTTLILSTLDYGCHIYSSASDSLLKLLDPLHHLALRLALGAFRSSLVESLYAESGFPPFHAVATSSPSGTMPVSINSPQQGSLSLPPFSLSSPLPHDYPFPSRSVCNLSCPIPHSLLFTSPPYISLLFPHGSSPSPIYAPPSSPTLPNLSQPLHSYVHNSFPTPQLTVQALTSIQMDPKPTQALDSLSFSPPITIKLNYLQNLVS